MKRSTLRYVTFGLIALAIIASCASKQKEYATSFICPDGKSKVQISEYWQQEQITVADEDIYYFFRNPETLGCPESTSENVYGYALINKKDYISATLTVNRPEKSIYIHDGESSNVLVFTGEPIW